MYHIVDKLRCKFTKRNVNTKKLLLGFHKCLPTGNAECTENRDKNKNTGALRQNIFAYNAKVF